MSKKLSENRGSFATYNKQENKGHRNVINQVSLHSAYCLSQGKKADWN